MGVENAQVNSARGAILILMGPGPVFVEGLKITHQE
jgi:hypothetical protein